MTDVEWAAIKGLLPRAATEPGAQAVLEVVKKRWPGVKHLFANAGVAGCACEQRANVSEAMIHIAMDSLSLRRSAYP